jgi:hypothetical protein
MLLTITSVEEDPTKPGTFTFGGQLNESDIGNNTVKVRGSFTESGQLIDFTSTDAIPPVNEPKMCVGCSYTGSLLVGGPGGHTIKEGKWSRPDATKPSGSFTMDQQ